MFERRLQFLITVLGVVLICLVARAVSIQVVGRSHWVEESADALQNEILLPTTRGRILDCKGRELAVDLPCIDACVDYRAITFDHDLRWLRGIARPRLRGRVDNYADLPLIERKKLLDAEVEQVKREIDQMWVDLAALSRQTSAAVQERRRQIISRVEARRQLVWSSKYNKAVARDAAARPWYVRLLGGEGAADVDKFDVAVAEQTQAHPILHNIDYALRNTLAQSIDRYPGLVLQPGVTRNYPYGAVACQTIGRLSRVTAEDLSADPHAGDKLLKYTAADTIGREGLEALLEPQLRGMRGSRTVDANDQVLEETAAIPGKDVKTTIDIELQAKVEKAFDHVTFVIAAHLPIEHFKMPGAAVVIDVKTGQVLTIASVPTYDLNKFDADFGELAKDQINRPLQNRALMTAAEPGSTVKPMIGLAAITAGLFKPTETIECTGFLVLGGRKYPFGRCWTMKMFNIGHHQVPSAAPHPTGFLTFADALERSCNVFHETLGDKLGTGGESFWFDKFGLGRVTGVGLAEAKGRLPDSFVGPAVEQRSVSWLAGIGEGQVAATPIQMANVAATIARNGIWQRPKLTPGPDDAVDLHLNPQALAEAHLGMFNVVNGAAGTGTSAHMDQVDVAAKTGSAQTAPLRLPRRDAKGDRVKDEKGRVIYDTVVMGTRAAPNAEVPWYRAIGEDETTLPAHAWMIGYAPAHDPKIAFAVFVEYGGGGGSAAGSVVKSLLEAAIEQGYLLPK